MATLYITEYTRFGRDDRGAVVPAAQEPAIAAQTVVIQSPKLDSAVFNPATRFVELHCDAICHVKFYDDTFVKSGTPTTVTSANKRLPAGATQFFSVQGGMLAVITGV